MDLGSTRKSIPSLLLRTLLKGKTPVNITAIKKETERHAQIMSELIGQLKTHILSLPDNPLIKRLADKPNCFVMSSKNLGNNWSVEHHDFKKQYEVVASELEASNLSNVFNKLHHIIEEEQVVFNHRRINLHPDVVSYLRKATDMPPTNCPICNGEREWAGEGIKAECHFCNK